MRKVKFRLEKTGFPSKFLCKLNLNALFNIPAQCGNHVSASKLKSQIRLHYDFSSSLAKQQIPDLKSPNLLLCIQFECGSYESAFMNA
jgi:hypothetical protein